MAEMHHGAARPLSPHLQVYRFTLLMALSILHRITGVGNYLGTILIVWWLIALASGPSAYATFQWAAGSPVGLFVLFCFTWSVFHHMLGGVRHLIWDTGNGLVVPTAKRIALVTTLIAPVLTVLVWVIAGFIVFSRWS